MGVPKVSVVIPTYHRPEAVTTAVRSALAQTDVDLEVIVVVDGCDRATTDALAAAFDDARLSVMVPAQHLGNADARNLGVQASRGDWIAFLDDDDLWQPGKIALQLEHALDVEDHGRRPIVTCRLIARSDQRDFQWPRRLPGADEPLSNYLFCRHRPGAGEGIVQTSTLLVARPLALQVPFQEGRRYVDQDWLLRAVHVPGVELSFVAHDEPLVVWNMEDSRDRISNDEHWRWELNWIDERRQLVTDRAYAAFLLTMVSATAARAGAWSAMPRLLSNAFSGGRPNAAEVGNHLMNFALPRSLQHRLAGLFSNAG